MYTVSGECGPQRTSEYCQDAEETGAPMSRVNTLEHLIFFEKMNVPAYEIQSQHIVGQ